MTEGAQGNRRGGADRLSCRSVEEFHEQRGGRVLRSVHETDVAAVGSSRSGAARIAKAGDEDLVEADRRSVRGDEVVPGNAGEELAGGRSGGWRCARRNRIDAALDADVAEVGADTGGRTVRARVDVAVPAGLAAIEDQLTESGGQSELAGKDVEDFLPLVGLQRDDVVEALLRAIRSVGIDDGYADGIGGEIRDEDVRNECARGACEVTGGRNADLIGSAEITRHRSSSNEHYRHGHNILHFDHNLLFLQDLFKNRLRAIAIRLHEHNCTN